MHRIFPSSRTVEISPTSKPGPVIYYVRHGQTDWNAEGRFQGRQDIALNDTGRAQARQNGQTLKQQLSDPQDYRFFASPMIRARETAEIILGELGLGLDHCQFDDRLKEQSYGALEGVSIDELKRDMPDLYQQREDDKWFYQPPDGESLELVMERIRPFFDNLDERSVVVAHGAVGRATRRLLLDLDTSKAGWYIFPQDKVFRFTHVGKDLGENARSKNSWNEKLF